MLVTHWLGTFSENTVDALKDQLGVETLDVVIVYSMEQYIRLLRDAPPPKPDLYEYT